MRHVHAREFEFQTADTVSWSRGAGRPRFAQKSCASIRGRRECRVRAAPRSRVQKKWRTHTSIQVQRRHSDIPCAMVLRLTSRSSRRSGLLDTVAFGYGACAPGRTEKASEDLTPTMRRQNHATSPYAPAPFVSLPPIAHGVDPALPSRVTPDAAASTASRAQRL
jgi:hypothetical protein